MRFYTFLNEKQKKIWQMNFEEFSNNANISWDGEMNNYIFKFKDGKKTKEVIIPQDTYNDALWASYRYVIKYFQNQVSLDILKQFQGQKWADEEIDKRNNPLKYIKSHDLVSNKEFRNYVKSTEEYKDYIKFFRDLAKRAEKEDEFTWNDVKSIASKLDIKIRSNLLNPEATGEATPGNTIMDIQKKIQGTSSGVSTFFHELGHIILVTKSGDEPWSSVKNVKISNTEWQRIFNMLDQEPKGKMKTSQTERYARLFQVFFTKNKKLKEKAPSLYKKVYELLEDAAVFVTVINHGGFNYFRKLFTKEEE